MVSLELNNSTTTTISQMTLFWSILRPYLAKSIKTLWLENEIAMEVMMSCHFNLSVKNVAYWKIVLSFCFVFWVIQIYQILCQLKFEAMNFLQIFSLCCYSWRCCCWLVCQLIVTSIKILSNILTCAQIWNETHSIKKKKLKIKNENND